MITIKARQQYVKSKLASNKTWALKGLKYIYSKQTQEEKIIGDAKILNSVGFSGAHAEIMSSFANQLERGWQLSEKQMKIVFKIMPKYWKQILGTCNDDKLIQCMLKDNIISSVDFVEAKL